MRFWEPDFLVPPAIVWTVLCRTMGQEDLGGQEQGRILKWSPGTLLPALVVGSNCWVEEWIMGSHRVVTPTITGLQMDGKSRFILFMGMAPTMPSDGNRRVL